MVERKQITLLYQYNDNWIGGTYYILNIIRALKVLDDAKKPQLNIIYNDEKSIDSIKDLDYPYINFVFFNLKYNITERIFNRLGVEILGREIIKKKIKVVGKIKNLYPINMSININNIDGFYFWIPDFQEWYLPTFFSNREIKTRKASQSYLVKKNYPVIFSSKNALDDFNKFYPKNTNRKEILRFVSVVADDYSDINISILKEKFDINQKYFIVPNQFWKHKNHAIIIEAAKVLKEKNSEFLIVFTGKEFDHRNPDYTNDIKRRIVEYGLEDKFRFLGFIDRKEQLQLMKNSIAIVQPSLFEGWSTVVEDTKALNHVILLSDIPLHREQIKDNCIFFDATNEVDLSDKLLYAMNNNFANTTFDVRKEQLHFAEKIISIF